jgi:para-aminobenzoate synthetase component 1
MARTLLEIPWRDPVAAFAPFRDEPHALLLLGAPGYPDGRWSLLAPAPQKSVLVDAPIAFDALAARLRGLSNRIGAEAAPIPFASGAAGFLAYECGGFIEPRLPRRRPDGIPYAAFARHDCVVAFDGAAQRAFVAAPDRAHARALTLALGEEPYRARAGGGDVVPEPPLLFKQQVAAVRDAIRRGDVFQANVSRLYAGRLAQGDHPFDLFARLARSSPAPFQAYLRLPDAAIVSNSPELCAALRQGPDGRLHARSSPIKGTRPRGATDVLDAKMIADLRVSEKERAENLMIVDLMRNDFGRVCEVGSVRVPELFGVQTFANVHHLVSRVEGSIAPGRDAFDLLRATFPAGSITGAPKIMAMQVIDDLEAGPRGASYGGIGWFGDDGGMNLSVTIRTAACVHDGDRWRVDFRAGGGITIDSDPEAELAEAEAKAQRLLAALTGQGG